MTFCFSSSWENRIKHFSLKPRIPSLPPRFPLLRELSVSRILPTFPEATKSFAPSRGLRRMLSHPWTWRNSYLNVTCHIRWERSPRLCLLRGADGEEDAVPSPGSPRRSCREPLGRGWVFWGKHQRDLFNCWGQQSPSLVTWWVSLTLHGQSSLLGKRCPLDTSETGFEPWLHFCLVTCPLTVQQPSQTSAFLMHRRRGECTMLCSGVRREAPLMCGRRAGCPHMRTALRLLFILETSCSSGTPALGPLPLSPHCWLFRGEWGA